ncbi:MAG TPA: hypothetical protein VH681_15155 [Nitrospiraceae bacterium]|jgi:hypothetical protein
MNGALVSSLKYFLLAGLLFAIPASADTNQRPVHQTPPTKPWHVTDLKEEGFPRCGEGTWMFDISWKPILQNNQPWMKYQVGGYKCAQSKYTCTVDRCHAEIYGCSVRMSGTWAGVTADLGKRISGMRVGTFYKPPSCK